jgi:hypothetical protein
LFNKINEDTKKITESYIISGKWDAENQSFTYTDDPNFKIDTDGNVTLKGDITATGIIESRTDGKNYTGITTNNTYIAKWKEEGDKYLRFYSYKNGICKFYVNEDG